MPTSYVDIYIPGEQLLLEKQKAFIEGTAEEPAYVNADSPGDYGHWSRGTTDALIKEGFSTQENANIGQAVIRRNMADSLLCMERTMHLYDMTRGAYYDQEIEVLKRLPKRLSMEQADAVLALDTMFKKVEDTIKLP